jgi:spermidine synthase
MAILWEQTIEDTRYSVRQAGASIRLYRNGVHHSQWNPKRPLGGSIWDLITLPALHWEKGHFKDVAILGFGAGAVGRQLADLMSPGRITGVDWDPVHLTVAGGFFGCDERFELVAGDAVEWAQSGAESGAYDLVVDDLYGEEGDLPARSAPQDADWFASLVRLLRPGGLLVLNMIDPVKIPSLPVFHEPALQKRFQAALLYRIEGYENRVLALSESAFDSNQLRRNLRRIMRDFPACRGVQARYIKCRPPTLASAHASL